MRNAAKSTCSAVGNSFGFLLDAPTSKSTSIFPSRERVRKPALLIIRMAQRRRLKTNFQALPNGQRHFILRRAQLAHSYLSIKITSLRRIRQNYRLERKRRKRTSQLSNLVHSEDAAKTLPLSYAPLRGRHIHRTVASTRPPAIQNITSGPNIRNHKVSVSAFPAINV